MYSSPLFDELSRQRVPLSPVITDWLQSYNIHLDILRLDNLHPIISGNKWFKLKNHLVCARDAGCKMVLSFGGAWSNHIHALAAAGKVLGFETIGVIRGEQPPRLSPTLQDAVDWGMRLHFVSRFDYREKHSPEFQKRTLKVLGLNAQDVWIVPEGGSGELGVKGCEDILISASVDTNDYDQIWLAAGTGATAAGVIRSVSGNTFVQVVAALKGAGWMQQDIQGFLPKGIQNWSLDTDSHCGGYAKTTPDLLAFIKAFALDTGIPLEPVYTGKVLLALYKEVINSDIPSGSRLLVIHTGGLQGARSL